MSVRIAMVFISIFVMCVTGKTGKKYKTDQFRLFEFYIRCSGTKMEPVCMRNKCDHKKEFFAFMFTHKPMLMLFRIKSLREYESGRQSEYILSDNYDAVVIVATCEQDITIPENGSDINCEL